MVPCGHTQQNPKAAGRGTYRFFTTQMTRAVNENRLLESGLRSALDNQSLELHFQPKFACNSLAIVGFEALVRWRWTVRERSCCLCCSPRPTRL